MSSFDKYDPISGGFRARLESAYTVPELAVGMGLNASGRLVPGAGATGVKGVFCLGTTLAAGKVGDAMTDGEIVEVPTFVAGVNIYADNTTGLLTTTSAGGTYVGHTVESGRVVVRVAR